MKPKPTSMPEAKSWPPRKWLLTNDGLAGIYQTVFDCENEAMAYKAQLYPKVCPVDEYVHKDEVTHLLSEAVREAKAQAFEEAAKMRQRGAMVQEYLKKAAELRENGGKK